MKPQSTPKPSHISGFTLVELLIAITIVGILAAIAIPSYRDHIRRGQIQEAQANMSQGRVAIEQWYLDRRTFVGAPCPNSTDRFAITCTFDINVYTITATGSGTVASFVYTLNQQNVRSSAGPWGSGACWISRKGQTC
jgi:type IV pilus assembly protein PilE